MEIVGEEPKKTIEPKITEIFEDEEPEKAVEPKITEFFEDEQPGNGVSVSTEEPKITEITKEPIVVKIAQSASDPQKEVCSKPIDVVKGSVKVNQNIREHSPSPTEEANPVVKQPTLVEATSKPIIKSESQQTTPAKVVPSKPIPIPKSAIPNIPTTMYDFEKNWKTVKNDNVLLYSWFKVNRIKILRGLIYINTLTENRANSLPKIVWESSRIALFNHHLLDSA